MFGFQTSRLLLRRMLKAALSAANVSLERPAGSDIEAPRFGEFGIARAREVRVELGRARQVVAAADRVFEPRVAGIFRVSAVAAVTDTSPSNSWRTDVRT